MLLVQGYRYWFKHWLGNSCRFEPSCSAYALQALQRHGAAGGAALTGWRLLRCHPWCEGGCDEVPKVWTAAWATLDRSAYTASRGFFTALVSTDLSIDVTTDVATAAPSTAVEPAPMNRKAT